MGIGNRIKEARLNLGYTQEELAKPLGVTKGAVANYEIETSHPKEPIMYKLFDALQVDANYLFQDEMGSNYPMKVSYNEMEYIKKYRFISKQSPDGANVIDTVLVREYSIAKKLKEQSEQIKKTGTEVAEEISPVRVISYHQKLASAGTGQVIFDDTAVDRIEIPDIPKYKRVSYAIGVNGHSMEPLYHDGDILLIEPTCEIEVGEVGIFIVDGQAYVKKLGAGELVSLNKGYENIKITEYSNCMGRVVDKLPSD